MKSKMNVFDLKRISVGGCGSLAIVIAVLIALVTANESPEDRHGVTFASKCEVCKVLSDELEDQLSKTGKSTNVIEVGFSIDDERKIKKIPYRKSEMRLMEVMENACQNILQYNIHKERKDSTRFSKGMSETFQTLHGLVDKGVKVELGIPYDLWDKPSVEIENLKKQCDIMLEENEDVISEWYFNNAENSKLRNFLCEKVLEKNNEDAKCLKDSTLNDPAKIDAKNEL